MQLQDILDNERFRPVYQPVYRLDNQRLIGFEALTRFAINTAQSPQHWFNQAALAGLTETLEEAVLHRALRDLPHLKAGHLLSFNVSPSTILDGAVTDLLAGYPLRNLVLELTEHESVNCYGALMETLRPLRERGLTIAIDDTGAGFANFRHILEIKPEIIKLDQTLTRRIDQNPDSRALVRALSGFARETGSRLVAEGVETPAELVALKALEIDAVQGYLLGAPQPMGAHPEGWNEESPLTDDSEC